MGIENICLNVLLQGEKNTLSEKNIVAKETKIKWRKTFKIQQTGK